MKPTKKAAEMSPSRSPSGFCFIIVYPFFVKVQHKFCEKIGKSFCKRVVRTPESVIQ